MRVQEIMTENPECCTRETKLQDVAKMMASCDCGAIPVVEDKSSKKPVGIVTDRDIVVRVLAKGENYLQLQAASAMTSSTVSVGPNTDVDEAEETMKQKQIRRVLVVDNGEIVGIMAQADIARSRPEGETGDVVEEVSEPAGTPA